MEANKYNYILSLLFLLLMAGCWPQGKDERYYAKYRTFSFTGARPRDGGEERYWVFSGGGPDRGYEIGEIYLRLSDGEIIKLADLSEQRVMGWMKHLPQVLQERNVRKGTGKDGVTLISYDMGSGDLFYFHDGRLVWCSFGPGSSGEPLYQVRLGPRSDGEFLSFPIKKKDLIRVFGKPDKASKFVNPKAY